MTAGPAGDIAATMNLQSRMGARFLSAGWLIPAFFPLALTIGRGAFNSLLALYVVWALLASPCLRVRGERVFLCLLAALLASYLPGFLLAQDPARAAKLWGMVLAYTSIAPITLAVLERHPERLDDLLRMLGIGGLAALVASYIDWSVLLLRPEPLVPRLDLRAVDLAFCLPFMAAWIWAALATRPRVQRLAAAAATALVAIFVVASEERGSLIGLLTAITVLGLLRLRLGLVRAVVVAVMLLALALALNGDALLRGLDREGGLFAVLDDFSSLRLTLWSQALAHPPEVPLIGVGMGNAQFYPEVVDLGEIRVRHLHNLWLDAWYETGWIGLTMLVTTLAYVFVRAARGWSNLAPTTQQRAALFAAAALAVLAQTQFSISYASREFGLYVFLCSAVLLHLCRTTGPVRHGASH